MITINLAGIYLCLCKLSATICLTSAVAYGILILAGVDIWNDEDRWGHFAFIIAATGLASVAVLVILLLILVIYHIWQI